MSHPGSQRAIGHDGLATFERTVLDLSEKDELTPDQIAARLAIPVARVRKVLGMYRVTAGDGGFADMARRGSEALRAAVAATGRSFA